MDPDQGLNADIMCIILTYDVIQLPAHVTVIVACGIHATDPVMMTYQHVYPGAQDQLPYFRVSRCAIYNFFQFDLYLRSCFR